MQEVSQSYCIKSTCLQTTALRRVPVYLPINPYPVLYSLQAWKLHHLHSHRSLAAIPPK